MSLTTALLLMALGAGVGVFGTLVGAGGGFILTPILLRLYPSDTPATITAISLVVVFVNALSGFAAYARQRRIDYPLRLRLRGGNPARGGRGRAARGAGAPPPLRLRHGLPARRPGASG